MSTRWLARRAVARIAVAGLALGLAVLAVLTLWGSAATQATTARVRAINAVSSRWGSIFTHLTVEDSALRQYLATGGTEPRRAPLAAAVDSAGPDFAWLGLHGGSADAGHARQVHVLYQGQTDVIEAVLGESNASQLSGYAELATLNFANLRAQIVANVARKQGELTTYLIQVDHRNLMLRRVAVGAVAVDVIFCLLTSMFLVRYQRRTEEDSAVNRHKALHDSLTGLANRQFLADRTGRALVEARRDGQMVCLLLIDLDRFKDVNDSLGHHFGDLLLQRVADRLREVSRASDTVARLGGDEFAVLLRDVQTLDGVAQAAERVRHAIQAPTELNGLTVDFGASVGASVFPVDCDDAEGLLQHADVAMYVAKRGGFGVSIYDASRDQSDPSAIGVLSELRRGIESGELVLFYQPKVDALTLLPCGVEALVRWQHPIRGLLSPAEFLPLIEPTEFIEQLTDEVLRIAVRQAGVWASAGQYLPISVNITGRSLFNPAFPDAVRDLLAEFSVSPDLLIVELTESALVTSPARASEALRELRARGIRASIDDFGTGYSSLTLLRDLPVHELKIDSSFVTTMRTDERNHAIVSATIGLARTLGLEVVAEGVEEEQTFSALADLGCQVIQGYYISKPLPVADLDAWLVRGLRRDTSDLTCGPATRESGGAHGQTGLHVTHRADGHQRRGGRDGAGRLRREQR
jgi:diguanylate cyclase (GGDEF)-like protein